MKKVIPIVLLLLLFCFFSACEKDDICVDGDTPLLVIGFFDIEDNELEKDVSALRIRALNVTEPLNGEEAPDIDRTARDSVGIPLQITTNSTAFEFIIDSADDEDGNETGNIDTLTLNYTVLEKFISRACGFVANYDDLSFNLTADSDNWIQNVIIEDTLIENSSNIHVKIFH
ncbi:DUF6452 family protein [Allomuricauda sp. d1]|uniref:DUF6452 family protein n=1 Tax=Allomuricauda sp. d1 TaxID=3136725 RepID=UPI0031DF3EA2